MSQLRSLAYRIAGPSALVNMKAGPMVEEKKLSVRES
jgi:hypothetical protein